MTDRKPQRKPQAPAVPRCIDYLLIGGGLASASAAETLRLEGAQGSIVIVGAEKRPPYHRPALSGSLMSAARRPPEPPPVLKAADYRAQQIELLSGVRVLGVDPALRVVQTDRAGPLAYRQLLIATGTTAQRLQLPGSDLGGIHCLRTADDALAIHAAARTGKRCVVIGASFIGMEVCAVLRQRGADLQLVTGPAGIFGQLHDADIAAHFEALYADRGVEVIRGSTARFEGGPDVRAVVLEDGRRLLCDFVVVGVGVEPELDFLSGSGIAVDDGVVVDQHLQASVPGVYAAGDVANFFDPVFGLRRRVEHWDNAVKQGRLAARNMLGQRLRYDEVSGFFCRVFDAHFQFAGRAEEAPQRHSLGTPQLGSWPRLYLKDSVPRALFTMNRPAAETAAVQALIRYRTNLQRFEARLDDPGFVLGDIPSQTVLVLQGGGALGAFECGAIQTMEARGVYPDIVAGVSIGAFNGAIVASHPRHATQALEAFWQELATVTPAAGNEATRRLFSSLSSIGRGVPGFFKPRWAPWNLDPAQWFQPWISLYDHTPVRQLLLKYIDFAALKSSPVRLLVSAVNVETAELEVFDSYVDDLTPEHLMASGSLPPGFPWTSIGDKHYWDGGIVSNSPLDQVAERCGAAGKRVIVIDLFPSTRALPTNLNQVLSRRDEIVYAERVRRTGREQEQLRDAHRLVETIVSQLDPATAARIRQLPPFVQVMGAAQPPQITRIVRQSAAGDAPGGDYDFSRLSIAALMADGREAARQALREQPTPAQQGVSPAAQPIKRWQT